MFHFFPLVNSTFLGGSSTNTLYVVSLEVFDSFIVLIIIREDPLPKEKIPIPHQFNTTSVYNQP